MFLSLLILWGPDFSVWVLWSIFRKNLYFFERLGPMFFTYNSFISHLEVCNYLEYNFNPSFSFIFVFRKAKNWNCIFVIATIFFNDFCLRFFIFLFFFVDSLDAKLVSQPYTQHFLIIIRKILPARYPALSKSRIIWFLIQRMLLPVYFGKLSCKTPLLKVCEFLNFKI